MEIITKQQQKLSLSSPLQKIQQTLLEQKKQNHILEKQNLLLNTKINFIQKVFNLTKIQNSRNKINLNDQKTIDHKQKLQQLYEEIKQQETWIKNTVSLIEQKKFQNHERRKIIIQKKLVKTNKKYKETTKKLNNLQRRLQKQQQILKQSPYFLAENQENKQHTVLSSADVISQLEKEHQQLSQLLQFKENQLSQQNQKVKILNSELIELLELKNYLKKYVNQSKINILSVSSSIEKNPSHKNQINKNHQSHTINSYSNQRPNSYLKLQSRLKNITN